jgi:ABC-2 type transport system ATP-binding protein
LELSVNNIVKTFGEKDVLMGINFSAKSSQALGLLGRNGAGKTTTMRIIMDVFKADSGSILVDNKPINKKNIKFGYMPEERGLYPKETIKTQLLYLCELNGIKKKEGLVAINKWLKRLDMSQHLNQKLDTLSKGNQQKIQLVSVLMIDPDIMILDEPFSGLDPVNAQALKDIVNEMIADNKIVIFSSHQMSYIEEFCNDIVILNEGKIIVQGNLDELKSQYPKTHINITGNDIKKIQSDISLNHSELPSEMAINNNSLDIYLHEEKDRDILLNIISQNSYDIESFIVVKPTLNEIFIDTAGGAI